VAGAAAVFESWDDSPNAFRAWLKGRGWHPSELRQCRALDEILAEDWPHELEQMASTASVRHAIYRDKVAGNGPIHPTWLASFSNVAVVTTVTSDESSWDPVTRVASVPLYRAQARREHDVLHELAHATLFPRDDHLSVQRLTVLLAVDRPAYQAAILSRGVVGGVIRLVHTNSHLPPFVVAASALFWGRLDR
jgi:hypothetical protein